MAYYQDPHRGGDHQYYKLWVSDGYAIEGHKIKFDVYLNKPADHDIKVYYKTYDGTAKNGKDYYGERDYVVIKEGEWKATIDVWTKEDYKKEYTEWFYVKINEHDKYVEAHDKWGKGYIYDDDHRHKDHYERNHDDNKGGYDSHADYAW